MPDESVDDGRRGARDRPRTEASYGIPTDADGLLHWSFVEVHLSAAENVWVTTLRPDGQPHARPTWGVWVDGTFHCGGGSGTRWVRNLSVNGRLTIHTESATTVVIVEGRAEKLTAETAGSARFERIDDAYEAKYDVRHGTPVFAVRPTTVLAWSDYPRDATRWRFGDE